MKRVQHSGWPPARRGRRPRTLALVGVIISMTLVMVACNTTWEWSWSLEGDNPRLTPVPTVVTNTVSLAPFATPLTLSTAAQIQLSTEEQIAAVVAPTRDLRELAMRLMPEVGDIPRVVNGEVPEYAVGDLHEFWVHDMDAGRDFQITAELIHKTDVAYAWVEAGKQIDTEKLVGAIDRFSNSSYPALRAYFGSEWNPGVDNDPRLHILHVSGLGAYIAGYYSSSDQYSRLAQPTSNEKEMFYIELDWVNSLGAHSLEYDTVLAHEFQHMIHWHTDMNEETWVGEGLSEFAQDVAGFGSTNTFARGFLRVPDTQLTSWGDGSTGNDPHYGAAYLFMSYFAQRFGADLTRSLVAHPANGTAGFDDILAWAGRDLTFDDLYADWVVANYVDAPDALGMDGIYGYEDFDISAPTLDETYDRYPVATVASRVYNYGTDYIRLDGRGDVVFNFQGEATTRLAPLPDTDERPALFWWSNRGDASDMRLTRRFDLAALAPGTQVEMHATMWWDIEQGYDYLYVVASRDGEQWTVLEGTSTAPGDAVNAFGPGYTGQSNDFRTERFDLSDFAGEDIYVRFEYVTDDAINGRGLFLHEVAIPAIDYRSDFAAGDGWESEGWIFTDNRLRQEWIVQVLTLDGEELTDVQRIQVDEQAAASIPIPALGGGRTAVVAISGAAPVILETAAYEYSINIESN